MTKHFYRLINHTKGGGARLRRDDGESVIATRKRINQLIDQKRLSFTVEDFEMAKNKRMSRDAEKVARSFASAIAAAIIHNPRELREAAAHIRSPDFSGDPEEQELARVFADYVDKQAERKEKILRETYGAINV